MRQPSDLTRVDRAVDVQNIRGGHPCRLGHPPALIRAVAGVTAAEVIGDAATDAVELDAAADAVAVSRRLGLVERQHL